VLPATPAHSHPHPKTVLVHGHLPDGRHWQLAAFEQGRQLGMEIEEPSGHSDSGQVGFAASRDYNYYWGEGLGPGSSIFYYRPVPPAAVSVRLTAPGWRPRLVRTAPLPGGHGLPRGRFFVVQSPSPATVSWTVVPLDAAGHPVAFAAFEPDPVRAPHCPRRWPATAAAVDALVIARQGIPRRPAD